MSIFGNTEPHYDNFKNKMAFYKFILANFRVTGPKKTATTSRQAVKKYGW